MMTTSDFYQAGVPVPEVTILNLLGKFGRLANTGTGTSNKETRTAKRDEWGIFILGALEAVLQGKQATFSINTKLITEMGYARSRTHIFGRNS